MDNTQTVNDPTRLPEKHDVKRTEAEKQETLVSGRENSHFLWSRGLVTTGKMTNPTEHSLPANSIVETQEGEFGCTVMDLRKLMELRSTDAINQINVHSGGVVNLCSRLKTNPVEGKGHIRRGNWRKVASIKIYPSPSF